MQLPTAPVTPEVSMLVLLNFAFFLPPKGDNFQVPGR